MKTMACANKPCSKPFTIVSARAGQQIYCSRKCRRAACDLRHLERRRKLARQRRRETPDSICQRRACGKPFRKRTENHAYCSDKCRNTTYHAAGLTAEMRVKKKRGRPPCCKWCRGRHVSDRCPNPSGANVVKQYGTIGPNREYIPPPGVRVRVVAIPITVHGDTVDDYLDRRARR